MGAIEVFILLTVNKRKRTSSEVNAVSLHKQWKKIVIADEQSMRNLVNRNSQAGEKVRAFLLQKN